MRVAGIVIYNPDIKRLLENINHILPQVDILFLIFNSNIDINLDYDLTSKVKIVDNKSNKGIAFALNQIINLADEVKAEWCLLLDQDSIVPDNIINAFENYTNKKNIGIICPKIIDFRTNVLQNTKKGIRTIKLCITSGSYINIEICKKINGFRNDFFIDYVDWEYCARLNESGYSCLEVSNIILNHELGNVSYHNFLFGKIQTYNHNAFRKYYITKNSIIIHRLYPNYDEFKYPLLRTIKRMLIVIFYEKDKLNKITAMVKGIHDGYSYKKEES